MARGGSLGGRGALRHAEGGLTSSSASWGGVQVQEKVSGDVEAIETEACFNIALDASLTEGQVEALHWLLRETYEPHALKPSTGFSDSPGTHVVEVGPRLSFTTAWSANAVSICQACGIGQVSRIERSRRYLLRLAGSSSSLSDSQLTSFAALVHDRMTEVEYAHPLESFELDMEPAPVISIPVVEEGRAALEAIDKSLGLAFDEWDLELFRDDIKRNPTNVELFDIAQSNSEHSRHWFFQGELTVDGEKVPHSLMDLVKATLKANPNNSCGSVTPFSLWAFSPVSSLTMWGSAIRGRKVQAILPEHPGQPSVVGLSERDLDVLFTAETHNFPCAVAPYPGAETGAGGRIRDTHATGIGSLVVAATAGYCVGNLQMEGHSAPWEDTTFAYPPNLAPPLQILLDASDGASDYGNKFGEPLIQGYTRSFGMRLPSGERREWLKPIMFSAGIGQIDHGHLRKSDPEVGMLVVKIGGPAYRIGMGGGAASSMESGTRDAEMDFNAVQRGDAEMAQKLYRAVRTCVEMGAANPIVSIHDQGAGGNCNVVKEIIYPGGAEINVRSIVVGDDTMSVLEIWGAEYQENDAILVRPESEGLLRSICARERLPMAALAEAEATGLPPPRPAVDLDLEKVLGDMPRKRFDFVRQVEPREALDIPPGLTPQDALERVLRLPSVCSKRFLTSKVDRCVTGLVAQQQTVGPLQLPLADVAVIAQVIYLVQLPPAWPACLPLGWAYVLTRAHVAPLQGLLDPKAMARLAIGEALTNLVWAKVSALKDVKASGNWMYAAKMGGEGAAMYDAALALRDAMLELEIAIDGGKDSLSMAAKVRARMPAACLPARLPACLPACLPSSTRLPLRLGLRRCAGANAEGATPLLRVALLLLLAQLLRFRAAEEAPCGRLGASALAHAYDQIGDSCPDVNVGLLGKAFNVTQELLSKRVISAGHDISDGGLVTALLEMAFAGNCGITADVAPPKGATSSREAPFAALFAEELGLLLEVSSANQEAAVAAFAAAGVPCSAIGRTESSGGGAAVHISVGGTPQVQGQVAALRDLWEETSFALERLQRVEACVAAESEGLKERTIPQWNLPFTPARTPDEVLARTGKPKVAIVREEGSNGDREMAAMVHAAGMEPWDVAMSDLLHGRASLDDFTGVVFVGGFSYADVLDSAKGWAGTIRFNEGVWAQFQAFYARPDTFSLGVCNGCQLMALLGWVPGGDVGGTLGAGGDELQPRFVHNESGRFECRFASVEIQESPSIMLRGMAGTRVGIWVAHGEGRALFPDADIYDKVLSQNLAPVRYCDDEGKPTEVYPFNPNGSPDGIAAICSPNGRHLAIMPHPERCYLMWQFPWAPSDWSHLDPAGPSPWLRLFQNAREWCEESK
eukprot:jgi/Mesen1/1072/ME000123S00248